MRCQFGRSEMANNRNKKIFRMKAIQQTMTVEAATRTVAKSTTKQWSKLLFQLSYPLHTHSFIHSFIQYNWIVIINAVYISYLRLVFVCIQANSTSTIGLKSVKCHNTFDSPLIAAPSSSVNSKQPIRLLWICNAQEFDLRVKSHRCCHRVIDTAPLCTTAPFSTPHRTHIGSIRSLV